MAIDGFASSYWNRPHQPNDSLRRPAPAGRLQDTLTTDLTFYVALTTSVVS